MSRRGSYAKGIAKREEILASVLEIIAELGYRKTSVREIAEAVQLSPAGLLHYFDSKEELFVAVLRKRDEIDIATYADEDDLDNLLEVVRHNAATPGLVHLFAQLAVEASEEGHPAHQFFLDRTRMLQARFRQAVLAGQGRGEIRTDIDAGWAAATLQALADGLQTQWMLDPQVDMVAHLETFLEVLRAR